MNETRDSLMGIPHSRQGRLTLPLSEDEKEAQRIQAAGCDRVLSSFRAPFEEEREICDQQAAAMNLKRFENRRSFLNLYVEPSYQEGTMPSIFWAMHRLDDETMGLKRYDLGVPIETKERLINVVEGLHILYEAEVGLATTARGSHSFVDFIKEKWGKSE